MGISVKTVDRFERQISHIGTDKKGISWYEGNVARTVILALIQDGIRNGYIHHDPGKTKIRPLSTREDEILDAVSQGQSYPEVAERKVISHHTVGSHMVHINRKLETRNFYHAVARRTYLKLHGQWEVYYRGRQVSNS